MADRPRRRSWLHRSGSPSRSRGHCTPAADTTTDSQTPSTNYGTAKTIYASPTSWKTFLRYDTSQIDDLVKHKEGELLEV